MVRRLRLALVCVLLALSAAGRPTFAQQPFGSRTISTITTTGTQTALARPLGTGDLILFANNATLLTIQGLVAGLDGQQVTIISIGAGQVDLANQSASATATNRVITGVGAAEVKVSLAAGSGRAVLRYDLTTGRWRVVLHEQGAWITPTYAAGDFTASSGTWTVDAGDVATYKYRLVGRTLTVALEIITTDVSATPGDLFVVTPGGFTNTATVVDAVSLVQDAGGGQVAGRLYSVTGGTTIGLRRLAGANWSTTAADNTEIRGTLTFEVQ